MLKITKDINSANLVTHSGKFHADEVFSTAFLSLFIKDPVVIRVNNVSDDLRDDVLVYDIGSGKFDHHMKDFDERHANGVKYASFGLLFREYGMDYLKSIDEEGASFVFQNVEHELVSCIDAIDNGEFPAIDAVYAYKSIDGIIGDMNVTYDDDTDNDIYFMDAVSVALKILNACIRKCFAKARAKIEVEKVIDNCSGNIIIFDKYMPFKDFVVSNPKAENILFAITPSNRSGYNVHTIPKDSNTHEVRCELVKEWGGLVDSELQMVSGIKTAKFVHSGLFLGVCETIDDALLMANKSIEYKNNEKSE